MLALATALVCGWAAGPAMAGATPSASSNTAPANASYPLSLRGNVTNVSIGTGADCSYCSVDEQPYCDCLFMTNGASTYWSWGSNPYKVVGFLIEVDFYPGSTISNGTTGTCSSAIGAITVEGTSSPNAIYAESVGTLCDAAANTFDPSSPYSGTTFTGSYLIEGDQGIFTAATGSGALSFGLNGSPFQDVPVTGGQLQMTGNLTPNSGLACTDTGTQKNC
jgi:hypothetical protein